MKFFRTIVIAALALQTAAISTSSLPNVVRKDGDGLQEIVTYDEHSLKVYGQRIFIFSGEFHPFRLPIPGLWLDVFQKVKALGFSAVSFYVDWALVEGQPGEYRASGIFDLEVFFRAASEAGVYLIARPGPYINVESIGGGLPGWLQRLKGVLRTRDQDYLNATNNYVANVGAAIAKAQITNGGPVILLQPENEYTNGASGPGTPFPDPVYFSYVENQYRDAGIVVPFINNDESFLTVSVGNLSNGSFASNQDISTTPLYGSGSATNLYIVRHADYQEVTATTYKFTVSTSRGNVTIPQLGGSLSLSGRDSKWHVTDYNMGTHVLLYSSAEIFTWKKFEDKTVVVVYGGPGEQHELAVITSQAAQTVEGSGVTAKATNGITILNWQTSPKRRIMKVGSLFVYILDRNSAYNYWVPDFERTDEWANYTANIGNTTSLIVEAGYLIRRAYIKGPALHIDGDLNATVPINVIGAPSSVSELYFNNQNINFTANSVTSEWSSTLTYNTPTIELPDLSTLDWKYLNGLPEIELMYDDSAWTPADHNDTNNPMGLNTPTSLYGSDYGYHAGALIFPGHFTATGAESLLWVETQGGSSYGSSVWLDSTYLGSWPGASWAGSHNDTYTFPTLTAGQNYVITVVVDNNGLDEIWYVGGDEMKHPRGILNYMLGGRNQFAITWKLTGNFGGEEYWDKVRGPLNEGGLYAERQGYTQPNPPNQNWPTASPMTGFNSAGIGFYHASFELNMPPDYDIPLTFNFGKTVTDGNTANYEALLWVNGYQFGKYINNIGPQSRFPVPQGILNYYGTNWLALEIWSRQENGAHLTNFTLVADTPVWTSYGPPDLSPAPNWSLRSNTY